MGLANQRNAIPPPRPVPGMGHSGPPDTHRRSTHTHTLPAAHHPSHPHPKGVNQPSSPNRRRRIPWPHHRPDPTSNPTPPDHLHQLPRFDRAARRLLMGQISTQPPPQPTPGADALSPQISSNSTAAPRQLLPRDIHTPQSADDSTPAPLAAKQQVRPDHHHYSTRVQSHTGSSQCHPSQSHSRTASQFGRAPRCSRDMGRLPKSTQPPPHQVTLITSSMHQ